MKILLIHNFYQSSAPSGEDGVFANELQLLQRAGNDVITFTRHNDAIAETGGRLRTALDTCWSRRVHAELACLLKQTRPDVAHVHNLWYRISPSALRACRDAGIPVLQTLHNFRMFCVNGLLMRDGRVCEDCLGKVPWRGVAHGCFRNSPLYSLPIALSETIHAAAGTWQNAVDHYLALTGFGRHKLIQCGLPPDKVSVKPNFLPQPPEPSFEAGEHILFLGRLTPEKGARVLVEAARAVTGRVMVVGDGAEREKLEELRKAESGGAEVEFVGLKGRREAMELLRRAKFLVIPSLCYEMFPLASVEAFACGKPVVASRLGALAEIVKDGKTGLLFEAGNAADLARKMRFLLANEDLCVAMGRRARAEFETRYTAERNYELLMEIYRRAVEQK